MKRDFKLYLRDIVDSVDSVEEFIGNIDFEDFLEDNKTNSAVVWKLETVGEASKNIPLEIRQKYPKIEWSDMARMRDKITHSYFGIDFKIVWKVIKEKLPQIKEDVNKILVDLEQNSKKTK